MDWIQVLTIVGILLGTVTAPMITAFVITNKRIDDTNLKISELKTDIVDLLARLKNTH